MAFVFEGERFKHNEESDSEFYLKHKDY